MKVGMVGYGAMGAHMAGHIAASGKHQVIGYDVNPDSLKGAPDQGVAVASSLADVTANADVIVVMVATDEQAVSVVTEMLETAKPDTLFAVAATLHPDTMKALDKDAKAKGCAIIDSPVVFGLSGAREGNLLSLCGGAEKDVERASEVLMCYSRGVRHMGSIGKGMLTKTVNNLMHWSNCVANFEAIALGKRFGIQGQKMREVLLECPARNGTLADWDETRLTWPVKDMTIALDLAEQGELTLPHFGQIDQLVRLIKPDQIKGLLYEDKTHYLGRDIVAMPEEKE